MIGYKPSIFWRLSWRFISPVIILVILVFYLVTQTQEELNYLVWDINSVSTLFSVLQMQIIQPSPFFHKACFIEI